MYWHFRLSSMLKALLIQSVHDLMNLWWIYRRMDWVWSRKEPKKKMELAALHPDQSSSPFEFAKKHQERQCCYLGILEEFWQPKRCQDDSGWVSGVVRFWENDCPILWSHHRNFALAQTIWGIKGGNKNLHRTFIRRAFTDLKNCPILSFKELHETWYESSTSSTSKSSMSFCRVASKPKRHQIFMAPTPTEVMAEVRMCWRLS